MAQAQQAVREEAAYYQAIEEAFVARRGEPLLLSNADWTLIRRWRLAGVPLRIVLRGIGDAFDARALSWARDRRVSSLRYCEAEVDQAFERWQRALQGGLDGETAGGVPGRLRLALLRALPGLARGLAARVAAVASLLEREAPAAGPALEPWLREREDELLAELTRAAGARLDELQFEVERDLQPYRQRLPERILQQVRAESLRRRLLEDAGLPRLSLFEG